MLRILLLEDDAFDADLIVHELEASGFPFELERILTEAELRHELEKQSPDLILSDHGLPSFDGFTALDIVRELRPDLPFIFVSGSNDQGMVARMYEQGATDYVFKRDLGDLKMAVASALDLPPKPREEKVFMPQPELKLQLPPSTAKQAGIALPLGRLTFCPHCRQTWDETGRLVDVERYLGSHAEVVTLRQLCAECAKSRGLN
jgi:CheY-like chemotaxis protein